MILYDLKKINYNEVNNYLSVLKVLLALFDQGLYVPQVTCQRGKCPGGKCPGGTCPGGVLISGNPGL